MNSRQQFCLIIAVVFTLLVLLLPPWNEVSAFKTGDELKIYTGAGFRPLWSTSALSKAVGTSDHYLEINWMLWLSEVAAIIGIAAVVIFAIPLQKRKSAIDGANDWASGDSSATTTWFL